MPAISFIEAELATREWAAQKGRLSSFLEARTLLEKLHANYVVEQPPIVINELTKFEVRLLVCLRVHLN